MQITINKDYIYGHGRSVLNDIGCNAFSFYYARKLKLLKLKAGRQGQYKAEASEIQWKGDGPNLVFRSLEAFL